MWSHTIFHPSCLLCTLSQTLVSLDSKVSQSSHVIGFFSPRISDKALPKWVSTLATDQQCLDSACFQTCISEWSTSSPDSKSLVHKWSLMYKVLCWLLYALYVRTEMPPCFMDTILHKGRSAICWITGTVYQASPHWYWKASPLTV